MRSSTLLTCTCIGAISMVAVMYLYLRSKSQKNSQSNKNEKVKSYPFDLPFFNFSDSSNPRIIPKERERHPVLDYQRRQSYKTGAFTPATPGDIFAPSDVAGPIDNFDPRGYGYSRGGEKYGSFGYGGASVNDPRGMGVPVPNGALKFYNEMYNRDQFRMPNPHFAPPSPPGIYSMPSSIGPVLPPSTALSPSGFPISGYPQYPGGVPGYPGVPYQNRPNMATVNPITGAADFYRPYGPNSPADATPFFGSVNAYSPFPEITSPWEKAGILTSIRPKVQGERSGSNILNLYRRPIAPLQDLWEYQVQDKDGFVIKLDTPRGGYLEDGDIVHHIIGKEELGPWRANIFVQNKYVWV